jgi:hypothetical protein
LITLKSLNEKDSVGQLPTHPPQFIHSDGVNDGRFEVNFIVSTGQISIHFVQVEAFELTLTHELRLKFRAIKTT